MLRTIVSNLFRVRDPATQHRPPALGRGGASASGRRTGSTRSSTSRSAPTSSAGASAWRATDLPVDTDIEDVARRRRRRPVRRPQSVARAGRAGACARARVAVLSPRGGRRQPLDHRRGRDQGDQPVRHLGGPAPQLPRDPPGQDAAHRAAVRRARPAHRRRRATSPTAPSRSTSACSGNYGYDGPLVLSPRPVHRPAARPDGARPRVPVGGDAAGDARRAEAEGARGGPRRPDGLGARARARAATTSTTCPSSGSTRPATGTRCPTCSATACSRDCWTSIPSCDTIMLHNIDTLGADLDPDALGAHLDSGSVLTFEVVPRRIDDRGGGLARVNGARAPARRARPAARGGRVEAQLLQLDDDLDRDRPACSALFGLTRDGPARAAGRASPRRCARMAQRMPTYVTIKDVKRRWGHGQEDVYPVAQFEKLWSDMTRSWRTCTAATWRCHASRGQQLKSPAELDAWANDGSRDFVASLCEFD